MAKHYRGNAIRQSNQVCVKPRAKRQVEIIDVLIPPIRVEEGVVVFTHMGGILRNSKRDGVSLDFALERVGKLARQLVSAEDLHLR